MLKTILERISSEYGDDITAGTADRAKIIERVNEAAMELHTAHDIREAMDEDVFNFDVSSQQIVLPSYIGEARHMRWHSSREKIELADIRNRYGWELEANEPWQLKFRKLRVSPLEREITNESVLIISTPLVNGESFSVGISGRTTNSYRTAEVVTFSASDLEKATTYNYQEPVISITKDKVTKYDITIKDVEDNIVAVIPNNQLIALYNVYQITDTETSGYTLDNSGVEVMYKMPFTPITGDLDSFWGVNRYDDSIFWKYSERKEAKDDKTVKLFYAKSLQTYLDAIRNEEKGQQRKMKFKGNTYLRMQYARERYHSQ